MSTSPSRTTAAAARTAPTAHEHGEVQPFSYAEIPASAGLGWEDHGLRSGSGEDAASREAWAREQGRQEGLAEARKNFDEQVARERSALAAALAEFTRDRAAYYIKVEAEVVQLALSIARKILHREAQVDPMLLAGIVRVALEKIEGATGVVLQVHPQHAADWRKYLALRMEPGDLPEIVEDPALPPDQCRLRTSMGTAELGMEVQLKEVERGLMDLLAARPTEAK